MLKKYVSFTLITLALNALILAAPVSAVQSFDSRSFGMGGIGVSTSGALTAVFHNPALIAKNDDAGLLNFILPSINVLIPAVGTSVYDNNKVLKNIYDLSEDPTSVSTLKSLQGKPAFIQAGAAIAVALPNRWLSVSPYLQSYTDALVYADISSDDFAGVAIGALKSQTILTGIYVTEFGIGLSKERDLPFGTLYYGITPKIQSISSINEVISIANAFTIKDIPSNEQLLNGSTKFNFDLGLAYAIEMGPLFDITLALVGKNMIPYSIDSDLVSGVQSVYKMSPLVVASASFNSGIVTAGVDVDLTKTTRFSNFKGLNTPMLDSDDDYQMLSLGAELDLLFMQIRAGYQIDLLENLSNQYTVGFAISPFGVLNINASAAYSPDGQYGGSLQFAITL